MRIQIKDLNKDHLGPPAHTVDAYCVGVVIGTGQTKKLLLTDLTRNDEIQLDRPQKSIAEEAEASGISRSYIFEAEIKSPDFKRLSEQYEQLTGCPLIGATPHSQNSTYFPLTEKFFLVSTRLYFSIGHQQMVVASVQRISLFFTTNRDAREMEFLNCILESPLFPKPPKVDFACLRSMLSEPLIDLVKSSEVKQQLLSGGLATSPQDSDASQTSQPHQHVKSELIHNSLSDTAITDSGARNANLDHSQLSARQLSANRSDHPDPSSYQTSHDSISQDIAVTHQNAPRSFTRPSAASSQYIGSEPQRCASQTSEPQTICALNESFNDLPEGYSARIQAYIGGWVPQNLSHVCAKTYESAEILGDPILRPLELILTTVPPSTSASSPVILNNSNCLVAHIRTQSILEFFGARSVESLYTSVSKINNASRKRKGPLLDILLQKRHIADSKTPYYAWIAENLTADQLCE